MKTKKPQKRFSAVFEIDAEIIKQKKRAAAKLKRGEALMKKHYLKLDEADKAENKGMQDFLMREAGVFEAKASRLSQNYHYIYNTKIPALVRARAALLTKPMPFMEDGSVVEERV